MKIQSLKNDFNNYALSVMFGLGAGKTASILFNSIADMQLSTSTLTAIAVSATVAASQSRFLGVFEDR